MQSNQIKSDSATQNLNLNPAFLENQAPETDLQLHSIIQPDSTVLDSLNANYIAPDSVITFGYRPEWSQFRTTYVPKFDYRKDLIQPLPYDSLQTVLKHVEVVFPGKKLLRNNPDWLIGVMVFSFIIFASVRLIFNKYLSQLFQATTNYSTFTRMFRERYFNFFHASFRLDLVFNLVLALFSYQFISDYKINFGLKQSFMVYLACLGIVLGYFTAKRLVYQLIGVLTESRQEIQEYLFNIKIYNRVLGLLLLPVTAIIAFVPMGRIEPLLFSGLLIIAILYLFSIIRGSKIFLKKHFSISYLILYLCTLEILPLILIYNLLLI